MRTACSVTAWLLLAGCGANAALGAAAPTPVAPERETAHADAGEVRSAAVPKTSTGAAPSAASPSASASSVTTAAAPPIASIFLPRKTACSTDSDCGVTTLALVDDTYECCGWCTPTAGTKAWVESVQKKCDAKIRRGFVPRCAPWDCAAPPQAKCQGGVCGIGEGAKGGT